MHHTVTYAKTIALNAECTVSQMNYSLSTSLKDGGNQLVKHMIIDAVKQQNKLHWSSDMDIRTWVPLGQTVWDKNDNSKI